MAWDGWLSYGGNEIINVSRTETYARHAELKWFHPVYLNDSLPAALGDGTYVSPLQDTAPWTDPDNTASYGFYGVFPLEITGLEDSSRTSTVTESIRDGGNPGRLRHGTKTVVFNTVLIGDDDAAVNYGFMWLKQALLAGPCAPGEADCSGADLCYLAYEPSIDIDGVTIETLPSGHTGPVDLLDGGVPSSTGAVPEDGGGPSDDGVITADEDGGTPYGGGSPSPGQVIVVPTTPMDCLPSMLRSLRKVVFNSGPTITSKRNTSEGGAVWTVTFTAVAGEPWEYGEEVPVIEGFLDANIQVPWAGGVIPAGGMIDLDGALFIDRNCVTPVYAPLEDPLCLATLPPPLPPSIPLGCYTPPANWRRRQITIPADYIPLWGEVVPKFSVHARTHDLRNLRVRFYSDVNGDGSIVDDPCAYCGDIVVSYVPKGSTLVFDGSQRQVYAVDASQRQRRADAVVFSTDGTPFDWPVLTCGFAYIVTLDLPQTQAAMVFDLSLFNRVA